MELKYAVIGTGALGGYYGGRLANAGHDVHFLFHSDFDFVKEHGLKVDSVAGSFTVNPLNAYHKTSDMPACDVILVCLKTKNNHKLKDMLPPILHKNTVVILIQNGLGIEPELSEQFPDLAIAGGLAFICSSKLGKGHIGHFDFGKITIGSYHTENQDILEKVCADFIQSGVPAVFTTDLKKSRWQKLVWNIPFNGMTVVLNTTTEKLMKQPDSRQLIYDLMLEVIEAANHCGVEISAEFAEEMMRSTDNMTPYAPSMKLDSDAKRSMEIRAIYTNPIKTALKAGYEMKKTAMLEQQLRFIQCEFKS